MAEKKAKVETVVPETGAMIDELVSKAQKALTQFLTLDQEQIDHIVHEMALAGLDKHQELARMAVEETGRGVYEDKVIKNMFATEYIWHDIKNEKTVGILDENEMEGYVEVAEPVGVICGVTPTTNPTTTTLVKSLTAVKTRNPSIFGFHPAAQKNTAEAARIVAESGRTDAAALSSRACADLYGLEVLDADVQDSDSNYTRFAVIARDAAIYPGATRTSLMLTLRHEPGSLYRVLERFYALDVNIVQLESRPIAGRDFTFMFYFDLDCPPASPAFGELLDSLDDVCETCTYFGSYTEVI